MGFVKRSVCRVSLVCALPNWLTCFLYLQWTCCQSKLTRVWWGNCAVISLNWKLSWPFQATVHFPLQILTWNHYHKSQPCGGPLWFLSFKYIHFLKETQLISKTHSSVVVIRLIATELWMHLRMSAQYISHHPSPPSRPPAVAFLPAPSRRNWLAWKSVIAWKF